MQNPTIVSTTTSVNPSSTGTPTVLRTRHVTAAIVALMLVPTSVFLQVTNLRRKNGNRLF